MPGSAGHRYRRGKGRIGKKLIDFCIQAVDRISCTKCREVYEGGYGENPPCGSIEAPDRSVCEWFSISLYPSNVEVWGLFRRVYNQTIPDGFGTGPLNVIAVYETMDRMGIERSQQLETLDLVTRVTAVLNERKT